MTVTLFAAPPNWDFPSDHGIHPDFDTEWYYITGHLVDLEGTLHGFQVTFFRHKLSPVKNSTSLWNSPHLYTAHFAFTNGELKSFYHDETMGRSRIGDAHGDRNRMSIYIRDWKLNMHDNTIHISIKSKQHEFNLNLMPSKPIVLHGNNGYSQKSYNKDRFSYYYSFTR
ncbi:MAG: carotenoid 1,2-hydratase, partial [Candidatus Margulisiibacteriota bacterium]